MKTKFKTIIMSIITLAILLAGSQVFAMSASSIIGDANQWLNEGASDSKISTDEAWEVLKPIGQILVAIGSVVLVICFMYLGIKYMSADPSGKADVKQKLIGLVIATVVIYGGIGLFTIIINVMNGIFA